MSFSSIDFLIFFSIILIVDALLERLFPYRFKELFLLICSYFFYGYWDWRFCFLLFGLTLCAYFSAISRNSKAYIVGIIFPLIVLCIFKYLDFFVESFSKLFGLTGSTARSLLIILPVGISFYTFQSLSYVIDVHKGKIEAETDFIKLALYISFFPQLVAGPIVRASHFLPQLYNENKSDFDSFKRGIQIFTFGLFKKIVLADHISVFVDDVYAKPAVFSWTTLIWATVSYSLQIYLDFSGYSDMAIGCAKCLGFDFEKNFDIPYISKSITEFWKRWHISLSSWLKEYLYIPLGGNRKGKARQYINLMITMLLGGLWHGANWTFVIWGGIHGAALCIDKFIGAKNNNRFALLLRMFITFLFVNFVWVFFRADSFDAALEVFTRIFTLSPGVHQPFVWTFVGLTMMILSTCLAVKRSYKSGTEVSGYYPELNLDTIPGLTLFFVEIGLIFALAYTGDKPFVYFQF